MIITSKTANKKSFPYNLSQDEVQIKVSILDRNSASYLEGVQLTLYSNITGVDAIVPYDTADLLTNEFGVCHISYSTNLIEDKSIETALMWVTFEHPTGTINRSNKTRVNFIYDSAFDIELYIIDANTPAERLANSDLYENYDANTPAARSLNADDYLIIERTSIYG